jgi:hypothetical protein
MLQNLGLGDGGVQADRLLSQIEKARPELTLSQELRDVREIGVQALVEDVEHDLNAAAADADRNVVKLAQMCCAMGGELIRFGVWGRTLTPAQQLFRPFSLESYDRGELEMDTLPRTIVEPTMTERAAQAAAVERLQTTWGMRHAGLSDGEIYGLDAKGEPIEQETRPGLVEELRGGADSTAALLGRALGAGQL